MDEGFFDSSSNLRSWGEGKKNALERVEALRREGDEYFEMQEWDKAISVYSECIFEMELCLQSSAFASSAAGSEAPVAPQVQERSTRMTEVEYSIRSEAWLRLEQYGNALQDAAKALELDPTHVESVLRKGMAFCGLECYQEAIACLQTLLSNTTMSAESRDKLAHALREAEISDKQSRLGIYDLEAYYLNGCTGAVPKCVDFVGPVEIKAASNGIGRGMFVTRDVKAGELLLVSNALAVARPDPRGFRFTFDSEAAAKSDDGVFSAITEALITGIVQACMKCPRRLQQIYTLSESSSVPKCEAPPMSLFIPPADSNQIIPEKEMKQEDIDVARIRRIVDVNAFEASESDNSGAVLSGIGEPSGQGDVAFTESVQLETPAGLWMLPSFINHSCAPDAKWMQLGDVMFVRSVCDIQAGEEVTIPYWDIEVPLQERNKGEKAGFRCCCPRCSFEKQLGRRFPDLSSITDQAVGIRCFFLSTEVKLVKTTEIVLAVEEILESLPAADAPKKNWIRASYMPSYLCYYQKLLRAAEASGNWSSAADSLDVIIDMIPSLTPTLDGIAALDNIASSFPLLPEQIISRCNRVALMTCQYIYGPLTESSAQALMNTVISTHRKKDFGLW